MEPLIFSVASKWVLAGEHAVLRGATAVVLTRKELSLSLRVFSSSFLEYPESLQGFMVFFKHLLKVQGWDSFLWTGRLEVKSTIPMGAGFGSSAALAIVFARWVQHQLHLTEKAMIQFAIQLEHYFHGISSGMDIAAIVMGCPIIFRRCSDLRVIPLFKEAVHLSLPVTFHDTGLRGVTHACIQKVTQRYHKNPVHGLFLDTQMQKASLFAQKGILHWQKGWPQKGLVYLQQAMQSAQDCFHQWGLVPLPVKAMENALLEQGALAVKLTGAGDGGMLVALWKVEKNLSLIKGI